MMTKLNKKTTLNQALDMTIGCSEGVLRYMDSSNEMTWR